jgi:hypothetical protein
MIIGQRFEDLINIEPKVIKSKIIRYFFFLDPRNKQSTLSFFIFFIKKMSRQKEGTLRNRNNFIFIRLKLVFSKNKILKIKNYAYRLQIHIGIKSQSIMRII